MSWLAGETKWWLLLAALLGFVLMWLFQLRRVSVTETASRGASRDGSLDGKAVAGAGAAGAGAMGAGAALEDRIGLDKPDLSRPDLDGQEVAEPSYDAAPVDETTIARPRTEQSSSGSNGSSFDAASPEGDVSGTLPERSVTSEPASGTSAEPEVAVESAPAATSPATGVAAAGVGAAGVGSSGVGSSGVDEEVDARTVVRPQRARHLSDEAEGVEGAQGAQGLETGEGAAGRPAPSSFGAGTAEALPDGSSPHPDYLIKGNADSMKFHTIESPYYGRTRAEVWFDAEESARAAGFRRWDA